MDNGLLKPTDRRTHRGFDLLAPHAGHPVSIRLTRDEVETRVSLVVESTGEELLSFYAHDIPLRRVGLALEFVVPEPMTQYAVARMMGTAYDLVRDGYEVTVSEAQDVPWSAVDGWALACPFSPKG